MTRTTLRLTLLVILAATALSACDSGDTDDHGGPFGQFQARVTGSATASLDGIAAYAVMTEDGQTATVVGLVDDSEGDGAILVLKGTPRTGTFTATPDEETSTAGVLLTLSEGETGDVYASTGGTVTVTRASGGELEGRFRVTAVSATDEAESVTVEGTFDAREGEMGIDAHALATAIR